MNEGIITIKLNGISFEQTERCRQMIHQMFMSDVFNVRNGKAILNFDSDGILADIEISQKTWSRRHEALPEPMPISQFLVETNSDKSTVARQI